MLGVTSNSGSSSSKPLSKAIREAPLLKPASYNPLRDACWAPADAAPYLAVAVTLAAIDGTSSRLLIADGLTNMFRSLMLLAPGQVTAAAYLVAGKIAPEYALGADLNIGGSVVSSALCEVCGVSRAQLRELYNSMGDLGDVAQACRRKQSSLLPPPPLTVAGVFAALHSLAGQSGPGAAGRRQSTVAKLLRCCRDVETKYLVRTLVQNLRVGAGWRSVLGPLAKAALLHRRMMQEAGLLESQSQQQQQQQGVQVGDGSSSMAPVVAATSAKAGSTTPGDVAAAAAAFAASSAAKVSKQQLEAAAAAAAAAYHSCPSLDIIVQVLLAEGPEALARRVQLTCGVPVKPMLAKACTSVADSFVQLAATAAAAAAGGVRAGRRSGAKQAASGTAAAAKQASPAEAAAAGAAAAAAAAVVVVSDDEVVGSGHDAEVPLGADGSGSAAEEDQEDNAQLPAAAAAAAAAADSDQAASTAGKQQQALLQDAAASSGSNSTLALLAEYKYDGQRAQIHVGADRKVRRKCRSGWEWLRCWRPARCLSCTAVPRFWQLDLREVHGHAVPPTPHCLLLLLVPLRALCCCR
ncbi:ATP-dependent DNA ligase [Scenedesmus sp. NREL 46B-D3]|nr:ATP-dependent DNA ligase [Scenedesmus sp. NREL 46B-D3]